MRYFGLLSFVPAGYRYTSYDHFPSYVYQLASACEFCVEIVESLYHIKLYSFYKLLIINFNY